MEVTNVTGLKRKAASPLKEPELVTDDLGVVTVEVVAGDEASKVRIKVVFVSLHIMYYVHIM